MRNECLASYCGECARCPGCSRMWSAVEARVVFQLTAFRSPLSRFLLLLLLLLLLPLLVLKLNCFHLPAKRTTTGAVWLLQSHTESERERGRYKLVKSVAASCCVLRFWPPPAAFVGLDAALNLSASATPSHCLRCPPTHVGSAYQSRPSELELLLLLLIQRFGSAIFISAFGLAAHFTWPSDSCTTLANCCSHIIKALNSRQEFGF